MALSREEQRLLDQMEAALSEQDPDLKVRVRRSDRRQLRWLRALCAGVVFLVGAGSPELANAAPRPTVRIAGCPRLDRADSRRGSSIRSGR